MKGKYPLKPINTFHPLRLLLAIHKTAERRSELLPTRPMRHAPQARTIPIYLPRLFIESAFLTGFFFRLLKAWFCSRRVGRRLGDSGFRSRRV